MGNTGPPIFRQNLPNDGVSLYGRQAKFRLRVYTSGGMTPDGVTPLLPTEYDQYFRVDAVTSSGKTVGLTKAGKTYYIDGQPLRVVGLANLGRKQASYDDCYTEVRTTTSTSCSTAARPRPGGSPPWRSRRPGGTSRCTTLAVPATTPRPASTTARPARRSPSTS